MSGSKIKVKIYTKRTLKTELSILYTNGAIFYTIFHTTVCTVFTLSNIILSVSTKKKNQDNLLIKNESEFYQIFGSYDIFKGYFESQCLCVHIKKTISK